MQQPMNLKTKFTSHSTAGDVSGFIQDIEHFVDRSGLKRNHQLQGTTENSVQRFRNLSFEQMKAIQEKFKSYADLAIAINEEINPDLTEDITDVVPEQRLLEVCAKKLGIVFDPGVYTRLPKGRIVEIYNQDLIQIYRSLSFFNLCSYNLLDLLTHEFHELYDRSLQVNSLLMEAGQKLASRPYSLEPVSLRHIPQHIMREKFSEKKIAFQMQFEEMYPVYTWHRSFYGYLIILDARRMGDVDSGLVFI